VSVLPDCLPACQRNIDLNPGIVFTLTPVVALFDPQGLPIEDIIDSAMRISILLLLCTIACTPSTITPLQPRAASSLPPAIAVQGRYVVLGASPAGETVALARAIVDAGKPCPEVRGPQTLPMTVRDNPHGFPVRVCEAIVPFDVPLALETADGSLSLPTIRSRVTRVLVMGDTGCEFSDCAAGALAQPFATMAAAAAANPPDVILHMGDFNYRGTGSRVEVTIGGQTTRQWAYDAGDGTSEGENCDQAPGSGFFSQNAANAQPHDDWPAWRDDFFAAAGNLLSAAPWVLARGNHELCSRAGPGWFYFLDPSSNLLEAGSQVHCPNPEARGNPFESVVLSPPYRVHLGSLDILVMDSANACDSFATAAMQDFTSAYQEQFRALGALAPAHGRAWLMSHRPIWGVVAYDLNKSTGCTTGDQLGCINQVLQNALVHGLSGALPATVELSLAGHMHHFQSLTFPGTKWPPQVVVGNSGVALYGSGRTGLFQATVQDLVAEVFDIGTQVTTAQGSQAAHGFLDITLQPEGVWSGTLINPAGPLELARCGSASARQGAVCVLGPGVSIP